jgi:hypothetical protein
MMEQEMRPRIARVIADVDDGRVKPIRGGPGRYLGSTAPSTSTPPRGTAKPLPPTKDVAPTTRTIRHPPLPYLAPDP